MGEKLPMSYVVPLEPRMDAKVPTSLTFEGNVFQNFKKFRQNFEVYMEASGQDKIEDKMKVAILLHLIGEEGVEVFNTLKLNDSEKEDYGKVLSEIENFFCQKKDVVYERFLFYSRKQRKGETFDHFLTDMKKLAARCEFTEPENMIRDIIIQGVHSKILQEELLGVEKLDMKNAIKVCEANESSTQLQIKEVQGECFKVDTKENPGKTHWDHDKKSEYLFKRVRSVLNKLTLHSPQKFDALMDQVRQLRIDTKDRLQGVVNLVFEKAIKIDKPNFLPAYAKMCKELQIIQVNAGTPGEDKIIVAFRTLLVARCQLELEKQSADETDRNRKVNIINECADLEKKKKLSFELKEYDRRLRIKSVGCIRFIGELFKQEILSESLILRCLQTLIGKKDEESIECLCHLLTTVGKELETKKMNLSGIFDEIKRIIDGKKQNVSNRIRFMLQDVTELRDSKWIPRRKTMDQIQKEAETEHLNVNVINMNNTPCTDEIPAAGFGRARPVGSSRNIHRQFSIQTDTMRAAKLPLVDEPLGSSQLFGNWGKGASGSKNVQPSVTTSTKIYPALDNMDMDRRPSERQAEETDDDKKTAALNKRVRSVLNKLTPQNFDTLVNQVRQLQIDTKDRLQGVVDLVFDQAITDKLNFSVAYAKMCKELQIMQVNAGEDKKSVAFRTLLVTRCQVEFEKQSVDETDRNRKVKIINECTDPEKKKKLSFELEEYDRRLRMKSVGCIRFIGQLFKQQMLTTSIMLRCLQTLIDNKDEESLECLCTLLTTVGKELETKNMNLSGIFDEIKRIIDGKKQKVSSRIRFMLQDVTELRDSKWIPRRNDANPKTMDQLQKEAENEHLNIQVMNMNTPRKDDGGMGPMGGGGGGQRQKQSGDGWNPVGNSRNNRQQFSIQTDKMRAAKLPLADEPLGSSHLFGNWGKGTFGSKNVQPSVTTSTNMYATLENRDMDRRPPNIRDNKDPYSSTGPSMERNSYKSSFDGRGSRSGSQHRDTGTPMRNSGPPPSGSGMLPAPAQPKPAYTPAQPAAPPTVPKPSEEQIERRIHNSLDEYLTGCCTTNEYFEDIVATVPPSEFSKVVYESYNYILEKSQPARLKTGELFAKLLRNGDLSLDHFIVGFQELLSLWEDLVIDTPQILHFFAEDLVHLFLEEVLPIDRLHQLLECLISKNVGQKLLKPLFGLIVKEKGPNFLQMSWQNSGMQLTNFMSSSEVESFIKENNFEFLVGGKSPVGQTPLSYEEIQRKLSEFFKRKTTSDDIGNWISANIGDRVKENKFIRTLATAIFEDSISKNKLVPEVLISHTKLIQKYVDNNTDYELQCLYALQSLAHKLDHPQGLLLSICDKLYEDSTFCQESFIAWENSADAAEQEGKGVALEQLTSFFAHLKEENKKEKKISSDNEDA